MILSDEEIAEFKRIWKEERGEEISDEEAREEGANLINLVKILLEDNTKDNSSHN